MYLVLADSTTGILQKSQTQPPEKTSLGNISGPIPFLLPLIGRHSILGLESESGSQSARDLDKAPNSIGHKWVHYDVLPKELRQRKESFWFFSFSFSMRVRRWVGTGKIAVLRLSCPFPPLLSLSPARARALMFFPCNLLSGSTSTINSNKSACPSLVGCKTSVPNDGPDVSKLEVDGWETSKV
ncbi:hypothetical protein PDE_02030 [Penicillium oxalicum 114-2]|uniref:Uncharacterized protein n=1 Tax=Penicillium oxalicum (strain 114-2 / CGMCC 5302) TaxID=933388 RepID=S7ZA49_PENO1|nr:hypothetical protein PDE_02030 [Penicillium oxalicum 114-2]